MTSAGRPCSNSVLIRETYVPTRRRRGAELQEIYDQDTGTSAANFPQEPRPQLLSRTSCPLGYQPSETAFRRAPMRKMRNARCTAAVLPSVRMSRFRPAGREWADRVDKRR